MKIVVDRASPNQIAFAAPHRFRTREELDAELAPAVARVTYQFQRLHEFYARREREQ